jgi:hypothetical protein
LAIFSVSSGAVVACGVQRSLIGRNKLPRRKPSISSKYHNLVPHIGIRPVPPQVGLIHVLPVIAIVVMLVRVFKGAKRT